MSKVESGNTVKVHYTGKLQNGEVFDTSREREPLEFEVGKGQMIKGFEEAVKGMEEGDEKTVEIPSDKAYGEPREDLFVEVSKDELPDSIDAEVGMQLQVQQKGTGQNIPVVISEIKDDVLVLDANHPLAGKDLVFDIELVDVS